MSQPQNQTASPTGHAPKWAVLGYLGASALAVAAAGVIVSFNAAVQKAQDNDPVLVMPVAKERIEDMGFTNVRFVQFNKVADKPAQLTFTATKDAESYSGEAHCTTVSCPRITVKMDSAAKLGS